MTRFRIRLLLIALVVTLLPEFTRVFGQEPTSRTFLKGKTNPSEFQCLTGRLPDEEPILRHELRLRQLEATGTRVSQAKTTDIGNIVVIEDDGTTIVPENPFNLDHLSILFVPNAAGGYDALSDKLSFEIPLGTKLNLSDDSSQSISFSQGFTFQYFGRSQTSVFVNSNGNLTFGGSNQGPFESLSDFVQRMQIAPFWHDLDPSAGDGVYVRQSADRLLITWNRVPEFQSSNSNTFQVALFSDGRIRFSYLEMSGLSGLVGISPGPPVIFSPVTFKRGLPVRNRRGGLVELFQPFPSLNTVSTAQRFYENHPDNFDVLTSWLNFNAGGASAFFQFVKNESQGIARRIFDNAASFGSKGRLQGFVFMNDVNVWPVDPRARIFGGNNANSLISIMGQELGHRWLVDARFNDNGVMSNELVGRQLAHWSFFTHTESEKSTPANPVSSAVEGNVWRDNGDGTFTSINLIDGYSPVDQYLMGLRRPEEVPDFFVISDPSETTRTRGAGPFPNVTVRGRKKPVSLQQIIQAEGPRIPDAANAPKLLRSAFVLVVRQGQEPRVDELARLELIRTEWEKYFFEHTGGRGTYDTRLKPNRIITSVDPPRALPGAKVDAVITGAGLSGASDIVIGGDGVTATIRPGGTDSSLPITIAVDNNAPQGARRFQVKTSAGILDSEGLTFTVSNFNIIATGLNIPRGVAVSANGDVFVTNSIGGNILKVTPQGTTSVFARGLLGPTGLTFSKAGELFVAESAGRISRVSSSGQVNPFATGLTLPTHMAFDSKGNLFVLNTGTNSVSRVLPDGSNSNFASLPSPMALFGGLAVDANDNIYVSNFGGGTIFRIAPDGQRSTFAVLGPFVEGMAFDGAGNLYVGNGNGGNLRRVSPSGLVAVISEAVVSGPSALAVGPDGKLYAVSFSKTDLLQFSPSVAISPRGTPFIASVAPALGPPGTTTDAVINGSGLSGATAVSISGQGVNVNIKPGGTPTTLPVAITVAPDADLGARQVVVTTPEGTVTSGNAPNLTFSTLVFAVQNPPTITAITPPEPAPGQNAVIVGTGFEDTFSEFVQVIFQQGAKSFGPAILERTGSRIVVTVPTLLNSGPASLFVSRSNSPVPTSRPMQINIASTPAAPEITSMNPATPSPGQRVFLSINGLPAFGAVNFTVNGGTKVEAVALKKARLSSDVESLTAKNAGIRATPDFRAEMKTILLNALKEIGTEPWTQAYLNRLLNQMDSSDQEDPEVDIAPTFNLQTGALVDLPSDLPTGRNTIRATVRIGSRTSGESKPFEFIVPDKPVALDLDRAAPNVRGVGQLLALATRQGGGFSRVAQENVATFAQGGKTFTAQAIGFSGTQPVFQVPDGLVAGTAEVRVSVTNAARTLPPSNPVSVGITPAPAAPSLISHSPAAAPAGAIITVAATVGSFSPNAQDNKITFVQSGGTGGDQTFIETALTADLFGTLVTVRLPAALKVGAVDFSVSSSFKGVASPAGVARRMTVAGTFIVNVPIMIHGFSPAANDVLDTAITLVNTSGQKAVVVFTRVNSSGVTLNPVSAPLQKSLQAGENLIVNASELFAVITSSSPFTGWVQIRSNVELKGSFALFDRSLSRLIDVAPLSGGTSTDLVFPSVQIGRSSGTNSVYALINPNDQPAAITLTEYDSRGGMVSTRNVTLPPNGSSAFSLTGPDRAGGSLRAKSSVPVAGAVFFGDANRLSLLNAKPASGLDEFVLAHFGIGSGFDTEITLTNSAASSNPILLAAFDRNNDFFGRLKLTLQPNEQLRGSVSSLFGIAPSQGVISGYLSGRSVSGLVSFGELSFGLDRKVASAAQEFSAPATHLVFPGVANNVVSGNGRKFVAGLALLNPQGNFVRTFPSNARIKLTVFDSSGNEVASTEMTIPPGQQVTQLLAANPPNAAFFQRALTLSGAYLVLTSDVPVSGSVVVFTDDLSEMFAVQGQEF